MHSLSLKFRITALALLAAMIPLFIFNGISAQRSKDNMVLTAADDLKAQSVLVARGIDRYLKQRLVDIKMISQADVLRSDQKADILGYLKSIAYENESIDDIALLDLSGVITASATQPSTEGYVGWDINLGLKELLLVVKTGPNGTVLASEAHMTDDNPEIIFVTPIYDVNKQKPEAILMGSLVVFARRRAAKLA